MTLRRVFHPLLVRVLPRIRERDISGDLLVVPEHRSRTSALTFVSPEVTSCPPRIDQIAQNLLGLRGARLRHHTVRTLRRRSRCTRRQKCRANEQTSKREMAELQPHKTDPPFTLMISPVRKLARSEARNRIGPAISSAVAGRPSGIAAATAFTPAFVEITGFDMSVATHPGAIEFTRMLCLASSTASPFTRLITPPLLAP